MVAIVENPLYAVINEHNSTMQRLIRKLSLLDSMDERISSGKLDMIIQLPLGTFGEKIGQFATAMGKLKTGMGEDGISESVVTSVTNAGSAIIALQEALPTEGWFDGKMDLDTFSEYVDKFADAMSSFSITASNMKPDAIDTAITTAYRIKNLINANENAVETPPWSGSLLKLPYNIDVSNSNDNDVEFVEYVGRNHPVSYYGTQRGEKATWNTDVPKDDEETLYALRRLAIWMGDCYVREPSGSGYWANISVSFNQKHDKLTIPVTLDITRVDGGK